VEEHERDPRADDAERRDRGERAGARHRRGNVREAEREGRERRHGLRAGDRRDRLDAAEVPLQVPGGDRVSERGQDHHQAAHDRVGAAAGVHPEQQRNADDADRDARQARAIRALGTGEREREQEGEDRRGRDEDAGERRGDPLLAERDQRERPRGLYESKDHDVAEPSAKRTQDPGMHGERKQHEGRQRGSRRDDRPRRDAVVERDLDEQVRRAPERAEQEEHR